MSDVVLSTRGLTKHFGTGGGLFGGRAPVIRAVDDVTLDIRERETFALVGESGCGKSTLGRVMLRLQEPTAGSVTYRGQDLTALDDASMRELRKKLQIVFQDPYASLNPRMRIQDILAEPLRTHGFGSADDIRDRCAELMDMVGLRRQLLRNYPHQFSGGQRQRIGIARALANRPDFVVCDESVSALDVSIQAQVLNLLADLRRELGLTFVVISHNLSVVEYFADRIAVMYLGRVVEEGPSAAIFENPHHPYTRALIDSALPIDPGGGIPELGLGQAFPDPMNPPAGCAFNPRCPIVRPDCATRTPRLDALGESRVACLYPLRRGEAAAPAAV